MTQVNEQFAQERGFITISAASDAPSADDRLGFNVYVAAVAAFLTDKETSTPLTFSIEGEWGSGKSSFMTQLRDTLKLQGRQTVWFNPWRHDKDESLWASFVIEFVNQLSSPFPWRKRLDLWCLRFRWSEGTPDLIKGLVGAILLGLILSCGVAIMLGSKSNIAPVIGFFGALSVLGRVLKSHFDAFFGNPFAIDLRKYLDKPDYENKVSFIENFHRDFDRIVKTLVGADRVFIFIDDLDRCSATQSADLIEAISLMLEGAPGLIFILGMDRQKIAASIAAKNEKMIPFFVSSPDETKTNFVALEFGFNYLEKFIQVPFSIPETTVEGKNIFYELAGGKRDSLTAETPAASDIPPAVPEPIPIPATLAASLELNSSTMRAIGTMVAPALDNNPRRIKQFLNLFRLRVLICLSTGGFARKQDNSNELKTSIFEIAKMVAIAIKWPLLIQQSYIRPDLLSELQSSAIEPVKPTDSLLRYWLAKEKLTHLIMHGYDSKQRVWNSGFQITTDSIAQLHQIVPRIAISKSDALPTKETLASSDAEAVSSSPPFSLDDSVSALDSNAPEANDDHNPSVSSRHGKKAQRRQSNKP